MWLADPTAHEEMRWKLDGSEDHWRRRMKLKRNYHYRRYDDDPVPLLQAPEAPNTRLLEGLSHCAADSRHTYAVWPADAVRQLDCPARDYAIYFLTMCPA